MDRYLVSQFELENPFPKIDISCYLEIFDKKNEYYITIVENGDCDRYILFLSFGVIEFEEDKIIFKDIRTGCDLVMTKVGKELFVNKGYYFMKNKCFIDRGKSNYSENYSMLDMKKECQRKIRKNNSYLNALNLNQIPLQLGDYKNGCVHIDLDIAFSYRIYYLVGKTKIYLSLGKWAKQGNKLLLQDLSLDCNFVYLIKNNYLYSIYSPNEIKDTDRYSLDRLFPFIMR